MEAYSTPKLRLTLALLAPLACAAPALCEESPKPAEDLPWLTAPDEQPKPLRLPELPGSDDSESPKKQTVPLDDIADAFPIPKELPPKPEPIEQAFAIETDPLPTTDDIGVLLTEIIEDNQLGKTRFAEQQASHTELITPEDIDPLAEARRLERIASEAKTAHSLTRLIKLCNEAQGGADTPADQRIQRLTAWAHHSRGRQRAFAGQPSEAIDDFRVSVQLDPTNQAARHDLAVSLVEAGDHELALKEFGQVLREDPMHLAALRNRAELLLRRGEPDAAARDCDAALRNLLRGAPRHARTLAEFYELRGRANQASGLPTDAALDFSESLQLVPNQPRTLTNRGNVFAASGFYDQAIADYLASLELDPSSATAYRSLAWVLATCPEKRLRDPATAVEAARRARHLGVGEDPLALDATAAAFAAAGRFKEAIRWQQRAIMAAGGEGPAGLASRLDLYKNRSPYVESSLPIAPAIGPQEGVRQASHQERN